MQERKKSKVENYERKMFTSISAIKITFNKKKHGRKESKNGREETKRNNERKW